MAKGHIYDAKTVKGVKVLKIEGAFTKDTIPDLQKICYNVDKSPGLKGVLLDFHKVTKIDTSAFACVVQFIKDHTAHGINIGVMNLKTKEMALAEILKIERAISTFQEEPKAIAVLSKKR